MPRLFFSYLSIVQILFKGKEQFFVLMEGFLICYQKHTVIETLVKGSCPYSAQTENHLNSIVENAVFQTVLDNTASTDDGGKWMCLPYFRAPHLLGLEKKPVTHREDAADIAFQALRASGSVTSRSPMPSALHHCRHFSVEPV